VPFATTGGYGSYSSSYNPSYSAYGIGGAGAGYSVAGASGLRFSQFGSGVGVSVGSSRGVPTSFRITDAMGDKPFTQLVNSVRAEGINNPLIEYVVINGENYIVRGNNRYLAAQFTSRVDELVFREVKFPVEGTFFKVPNDVLDTIGTIKPPKYRGR
jgi:hypothetical protein